MSNILSGLEPASLWKNFEAICSIAHPSGKEEKLRNYILNFAKNLGLETYVDEVGNLIVRKPATKGKENVKGVILQGHIDMVPQKNNDTKHDFDKDPIIPRIEGEWVFATGTTLGADNGIGVAAAMAVLESKTLEHGPIECLFTIDEETGMTGAFGLKPNVLKGSILMNLDSEDESELYIGCAGGMNVSAQFKYTLEATPAAMVALKISVTGLKGGHSGMDINLGRGNSNKIITRLLWNATKMFGLRIAGIEGGSLRNAIPREAFADVVIPSVKLSAFTDYFNKFESIVKNELASTEPDLKIEFEKTNLPVKVIDLNTQNQLLKAIYGCPNGVIAMCADMPGLVETSTNLAIIKFEKDFITVESLLRSSVDSSKDDLAEMVENVFTLAGATVEKSGTYPGWKPNVKSEILSISKSVYKKLNGQEPDVKAIHAGLECGLFGMVYKEWDMISFGPTIRHPHSPDEKLKIASVGKFWKFLTELLKNIK